LVTKRRFLTIFRKISGFELVRDVGTVVSCRRSKIRSNSGRDQLFARFSGLSTRTEKKAGVHQSSQGLMARKEEPAVAVDAERAKMMAMYEENPQTFTKAPWSGQVVEVRPRKCWSTAATSRMGC
jgi:hypothetical protein